MGDLIIPAMKKRKFFKEVSYRPTNYTIEFNDNGQDFLEWDIKEGIVIDCRPHQGSVWRGTRVLNERIEPGDTIWIWISGEKSPSTLNYTCKSIKNKE